MVAMCGGDQVYFHTKEARAAPESLDTARSCYQIWVINAEDDVIFEAIEKDDAKVGTEPLAKESGGLAHGCQAPVAYITTG